MKKLFLSFSVLACLAFFASCSTKVDLYADYKDIPIIYGLIDATLDTNYVKIVRAFSGSDEASINANEVALIADSCNYPGKLKAYILPFESAYANEFYPTGDTIFLDTITIHDKEDGIFYAPNQKVYYTTEQFKTNTSTKHYRYRLEIPKGDEIVSSETGVVGGDDFKILTSKVNFVSEETDRTGKITFKKADNAVVYYLKMQFFYREFKQGQESLKEVHYAFPAKSVDDPDMVAENDIYTIKYNQNLLFTLLEYAIGGDTLNVTRYFGDFYLSIAAGGEELYNYIQVNQQAGGLAQTIPDYTNIVGGYGVFSSRINVKRKVDLTPRTQTDLIGKSGWGFRQL